MYLLSIIHLSFITMCNNLTRYVRKLLPELPSRYSAFGALLAAIGLSAWWLAYTIQSKWIEADTHPQQVSEGNEEDDLLCFQKTVAALMMDSCSFIDRLFLSSPSLPFLLSSAMPF